MVNVYCVKATCPYCDRVQHLISVNPIRRLVCEDCAQVRAEIAEMILEPYHVKETEGG